MVWGGIFLVWTALAALSVSQSAIFSAHVGRPVDWRAIATLSFADWYTCAVFTPPIIWLVRRFPIDRAHWAKRVPLHIVAVSVIVIAKYALYGEVRAALVPESAVTLEMLLLRSFISESIAFWAMLGVVHALEFHRRYREREVHAARLQAQLAEARLDALSAQLHPHFLFNTLHGVSTLMHRDVDAADAMLTRLSDLLRRTLSTADRHEVTLAEELELLDGYVEIVRVRFQDRLTIEHRVAAETLDALVPRFLLQPLVENAIQHGIARRAGAGRIEIAAECDATRGALHLSVSDDGAGLRRGSGDFPTEGIGLSNTRRRLAELYGTEQRLALEEAPGGGLRVRVTLPLRHAEHTTPAPSPVSRPVGTTLTGAVRQAGVGVGVGAGTA